jgi:hypothetical protein
VRETLIVYNVRGEDVLKYLLLAPVVHLATYQRVIEVPYKCIGELLYNISKRLKKFDMGFINDSALRRLFRQSLPEGLVDREFNDVTQLPLEYGFRSFQDFRDKLMACGVGRKPRQEGDRYVFNCNYVIL